MALLSSPVPWAKRRLVIPQGQQPLGLEPLELAREVTAHHVQGRPEVMARVLHAVHAAVVGAPEQ